MGKGGRGEGPGGGVRALGWGIRGEVGGWGRGGGRGEGPGGGVRALGGGAKGGRQGWGRGGAGAGGGVGWTAPRPAIPPPPPAAQSRAVRV